MAPIPMAALRSADGDTLPSALASGLRSRLGEETSTGTKGQRNRRSPNEFTNLSGEECFCPIFLLPRKVGGNNQTQKVPQVFGILLKEWSDFFFSFKACLRFNSYFAYMMEHW